MENLLQIKEKLKSVYGKYDTYLISVIKFVLALITFLMINKGLGYFQKLDNIIITLIVALFCSFLPVNAIVLFGSVLLAAQLYGFSIMGAVVGGGLILIVLLLHFGIAPKYGYALAITPLALAFQIPCAVPLVLGLCATPLAGAGTVFGVILFYSVNTIVKTNVSAISDTAASGNDVSGLAIMEELKAYLDGILKNTEMIVMVITLLAVLLVVYVIRKMAIKHAWSVASGAGAFTYLAVTFIGRTTLEMELDYFWMILGTVLSLIIAVVLEFFVLGVDYRRTESVQFEDDDYYYYVKAVPKLKTAAAIKEEKGRRKAEERLKAGSASSEKRSREYSGELAPKNVRRPEGERTRERPLERSPERSTDRKRSYDEPYASEERKYRRTEAAPAADKAKTLDVPYVQRPAKGMDDLSEIERKINSQMNLASRKHE